MLNNFCVIMHMFTHQLSLVNMNCLLVSKSLLYIGVFKHCICVNFWKVEIVIEMPHAIYLTNFCKILSAGCTSKEKDSRGKLCTHTSLKPLVSLMKWKWNRMKSQSIWMPGPAA